MCCKAMWATGPLATLLLLAVPGSRGESADAVQDVARRQAPSSQVLWDVASSGLFDKTNKAYSITNGRVTVDLRDGKVRCPTGLGHLASGRDKVNEILFVFDSSKPEENWLHVDWNPGGSGREQMAILVNGSRIGDSRLVDGKDEPYLKVREKFSVRLTRGVNEIVLRHLSGDGLRFGNIVLSRSDNAPVRLKPNLKFPTLRSYEKAIREAGVMLDSTYVCLFTPKRKAKEAKILFEYLVKAYDELYRIVGMHTEYKIVVYHFPEGSRQAWGGTSNCVIWYGYKNLDLTADKEWTKYRVPHVSGYIEEMAHSFVHATRAQFGWEMIGWSIGIEVSQKVAGNAILARQVQQTREVQQRTFRRYVEDGFVFPRDIPPNLCDRIHAWVLWQCEKQYGPRFWQGFFSEIQKARDRLSKAAHMGGDAGRNKRYQITVECFDRLKKLQFKRRLRRLRISLTTDVKSLHPTKPIWNRTFMPTAQK